MSLAGPTSPGSSAGSIPTIWDPMQVVLDAERATRVAAVRRDFEAEPVKERTVADIEDDIRRYTDQLQSKPVIGNLRWFSDVTAKLTAAQTELAAIQNGATR
jgi:hypothetical protein